LDTGCTDYTDFSFGFYICVYLCPNQMGVTKSS
jgi:hypothetical protein